MREFARTFFTAECLPERFESLCMHANIGRRVLDWRKGANDSQQLGVAVEFLRRGGESIRQSIGVHPTWR